MSRTRGRPPLDWMPPDAIALLPFGVALSVERTGRRSARLVGRLVSRHLAGAADTTLTLTTTTGEVTVTTTTVRRLRIVPSLYEPGDPVVRRGVPEADWRGGVVRTADTDVLVEQLDGSFAWYPESALEPAEARDPALPALRRGPVPAGG